jgi:hypothetical protein
MLPAKRIPTCTIGLLRHLLGWALAAWLPVVGLAADAAPETSRDATSATVRIDGRPLVQYRFVESPNKPYAAELFSPAGVQVLRDAPSDHLHHHGLMFAVAVDGVDFWSETPQCGKQRHRAGDAPQTVSRDGIAWTIGSHRIEWMAPGDKKLLLRETRTLEIARLQSPLPATVVVWKTRLEPPPGKASVTLSGSTYFGLGARFVQSMDAGGSFLNADGKTGVDGTNAVRSAWCAYSARAGGKPVTVAMLDDPQNPRFPATWFTLTQGFAYLAATLDLSKQPLVVSSDKPLALRCVTVVCDGPADAKQLDALAKKLAPQ